MKIFECNENIQTYKYPIIKMILCSLIIILMINIDSFIHVKNVLLNIGITIVSVSILLLAVLHIYISFAEIILLSDRREAEKKAIGTSIKHSEKRTVDYILSLLKTNDILEVIIFFNNRIIKFGASSDYTAIKGFFNKQYYVDGNEDVSLEELKKILNDYAVDGELCVVTIDGMPPSYFNYK